MGEIARFWGDGARGPVRVGWAVMPRLPTSLARARASLHAHPRWRWMALVVVAGGMMLSVVNISIVNIALPQMADDLGTDVPGIAWVVSGFLVTQATLLPIAGRAGDLYGRRRVLVAGVVVMSLASIACALAWDAPSLVAFRILQGAGGAAMAPTAFSYAAVLFRPQERGQALGVLAGVMGLAPVLALNVAGLLVGWAGWRAVFWFTPVIGALVLLGAALVLDETARAERQPFDVPGALLAASGLFLILLALSRGGAWGWTSAATLGAAALGVLALGLMVWRESRAARPMVDLGLFRLRSLRTANLTGFSVGAALFGTLLMLPFYFTAVLGLDAILLSLAITPVAASFMVVAPIAGRLMSRVGSDRMAVAGLVVATAGALALALAAPSERYGAVLPGIVALGVGMAMATSPVTTTAIHDVPADRLGVASSLPNISRYTGGALGAAVLGAVLAAAVPAAAGPSAGRVEAALRQDVAAGVRAAVLVAAAFLAVGALAATRMPRVVGPGARLSLAE